MNSMAIDRRKFLIGSLVALAQQPGLAASFAKAADRKPSAAFITAARLPEGDFAALVLSEAGEILRTYPLSGRGHDIAIDTRRHRAVVFARRPGHFAIAFDYSDARPPDVIAPEAGRTFFGHGAFAADGRLLYTSENITDTGEGRIGIYETGRWGRIGDMPSYGPGPHEAILLPDGRTLAVANGGFATEPVAGREPVAISEMDPSLAFIDVRTGALKAKHALPPELRALSIRHIAARPNGDVWFGGQWQAGLETTPALIGNASLDKPLRILDQKDNEGMALKGYIGSVALSADGRLLAASAPRAGRIVYTDTETGKTVHEALIPDGCGIAPASPAGFTPAGFTMSSGLGELRTESADGVKSREQAYHGYEFDNHLRLIPPSV